MKTLPSELKLKMLLEDSLIPLAVGDQCNVRKCDLSVNTQSTNITQCTIIDIADGVATVTQERSTYTVELTKLTKYQRRVGINPYPKERGRIETFASPLSSILHSIGYGRDEIVTQINGQPVREINWMPFVYDATGEKWTYQRKLVWTLKDKHLLLNSIYHGIECGRILLRQRSWQELKALIRLGETDLAFADIVDGKQRLAAVIGFIEGDYKDAQGHRFSDFSDEAQKRFLDHKLFAFSHMSEGTKDADVIYQFQRLNFAGVPQSQEHLNYIEELAKKM